MGFLKRVAIRIAAQSTAKSIGKYLSTPNITPVDAIILWANTRPKKHLHFILIDSLVSGETLISKLDLSLALFYAEMEIEESDLKDKFKAELINIFKVEVGYVTVILNS